MIGEVEGRTCIIVDDISHGRLAVQGGGSAEAPRRAEVHAYVTHAVLSGPAVERIDAARR